MGVDRQNTQRRTDGGHVSEKWVVVGSGPKNRVASHIPKDRLKEVKLLKVGDSVDVLLDDGSIVRSKVRGEWHPMGGSGDGSLWFEGMTGSYAAGRMRLVGGWAKTPGCKYEPGMEKA